MAEPRELFNRYHLPIFRYLQRMIGSVQDAEELTQEVFLRVVRAARHGLPEDVDAARWLFTIARNLLLNRARDRGRHPEFRELDEVWGPTLHTSQVDRFDIEEAISRLPESDKEAFLMREVGGLGYEEISVVCAATPDAVRSRIYRARQALRVALSPSARGPGKDARKEMSP